MENNKKSSKKEAIKFQKDLILEALENCIDNLDASTPGLAQINRQLAKKYIAILKEKL